MKILLLTSPAGRRELPVFPLGLAYIAASLKQHSVRVFDLNVIDRPLQKLDRIVEEESPDVIGVSLRYIDTSSSYDKFSYYPGFISCIRHLRKIKRNATLIVGRAGFTLFPRPIMQEASDIDFGVLFEGENTIVELVENLNRPDAVKGICYRNNGRVRFTEKRDLLKFDNLFLPKRDILDINAYKHFHEQMGVQTKRGCIFNCIYCSYPSLEGNRICMQSPQRVADDIEILAKAGIQKIFFNDCMFNYPQDHAVQICREIIGRGIDIKWKAFFNEKFMDQKVFSLAKEAGCELFIFGSDGSNPQTLKSLKKNFSYREMVAAYNLFKKPDSDGANFKCTFMFNGPGDEKGRTIFDIFKLVSGLFLKKKRHFQFSIGNIRIYPHTELHRISLIKGLISKNDNLIFPRYYDPFPMRIISYCLNLFGSFIYTIKRRRRCKKIGR